MRYLGICIFIFLYCSTLSSNNVGFSTTRSTSSMDTSVYKHELVIFTGSDWCANCRRMDDKILSDSNFTSYLKSNKIKLVLVDFPQRREMSEVEVSRNDSIAGSLDFDGVFPGIVLLRSSDKAKFKISYQHENLSEFEEVLNQHLKKLP